MKKGPRINKTQEVKEKTTGKDRKFCTVDTGNKLSGPRGKQEDVWMKAAMLQGLRHERGQTGIHNENRSPQKQRSSTDRLDSQTDGWTERAANTISERFLWNFSKIFHMITGNSNHQGIMLVSLRRWEPETWINIAKGHLGTSVAV